MIRFWSRIKFIFTLRKSVPFIKEFFSSNEVSRVKKFSTLFLMCIYLFFPMDLIPDYLVLIGFVDDFAVISFILQLMVIMAPPDLKHKYELDQKA